MVRDDSTAHTHSTRSEKVWEPLRYWKTAKSCTKDAWELHAALRRVFENHCFASNTYPASYNATTLAMIKPRKHQRLTVPLLQSGVVTTSQMPITLAPVYFKLSSGKMPSSRSAALFTTLLWQNNGRQYVLISRMVLSESYKFIVEKDTFACFKSGDLPPLDAPLG